MGIIDKKVSLRNRGKLLLGVYDDEDQLMTAAKKLAGHGIPVLDIYTPYPIHGLDRIIGVKRTNLTVIAFLCGLTGFSLATLMIWYMNVHDWPMIVGNKPLVFATSWIPVMFESTILCTAFGMAFFFFWRNRLAHGIQPELLDDRQTDDRMIVVVEAEHANAEEVMSIYRSTGAVETRERVGGVQTTIN
jgi:hypothetical protein